MQSFLSKKWFFLKEFSERYWTGIPKDAMEFELNADDRIDLDCLLETPGADCDDGMVFNRFEMKADTLVAFGACCDWWFEARIDGRTIYTTFPGGNVTPGFTSKDHLFAAELPKGEHMLAIHVRRGSGSWKFGFSEQEPMSVDPCAPLTIEADLTRILGPIKPMNAVNNGPIRERSDQSRGNFKAWVEAKIPFARNHDAAFCSSYGGEHCVDIHAIFPDFKADANDPASYDFDLTDDYLKATLDAGTQIFYRLGSKIEHLRKKYGTVVPPDFQKWAVICEHIIRHYNEGWANGFHWNIIYWEIWNEPDLDPDDSPNKRNWQGTEKQFFELYKIAAKHLKGRFPNLKIGGPALAGNFNWMKRFFKAMSQADVPIDFFSWHSYSIMPIGVGGCMRMVRESLDEYGYANAESILNEWNYVRSWTTGFVDTIRTIISLKGAIYASAVMAVGQDAPLDMLMYYDARPCAFNGLFDYYTFRPLKTYYVFLAWSKLAKLGKQFFLDTHCKNGIYAVGATDEKGRAGIMISRFFEPDDLPGDVEITVKMPEISTVKVLILDDEHDLTEVPFKRIGNDIVITQKANTLVYLDVNCR